MGVHVCRSTLEGGFTPICNDCGISLCYDISALEYDEEKVFWDSWRCKECNDGESMSLKQWSERSKNTNSEGQEKVIIYTDGACKGNPGPGGWGAVLSYKGSEKEMFGGDPDTTNNRMELMASIQALEALKKPCQVKIHTDSKYVIQGITEWLPSWKKRGWKTATKSPVKNEDLWRRLDTATSSHNVDWVWVKGHNGIAGNERADNLANKGVIRSGSLGSIDNLLNNMTDEQFLKEYNAVERGIGPTVSDFLGKS